MEIIKLTEEEIILNSKEADERSRVYLLLSGFYMERPGEEFIAKLQTAKFRNTLEILSSSENSKIAEAAELFRAFLDSIRNTPIEEVAVELGVDFTRLFRGIKKGYSPPPPYESLWRGEDRIMGEWTLKVLEKYQNSGISMDMRDEIPDYIGIELKFMSLLCFHEANCWKEIKIENALRFLEMEAQFLRDHLGVWVPAYVTSAMESAKTLFYKAALHLTVGVLEMEQSGLMSMLFRKNHQDLINLTI